MASEVYIPLRVNGLASCDHNNRTASVNRRAWGIFRCAPPVSVELQRAALRLCDLLDEFEHDYREQGYVSIEKNPDGRMAEALQYYRKMKVIEYDRRYG